MKLKIRIIRKTDLQNLFNYRVTNHIKKDMIGGSMKDALLNCLKQYPVFSVRDIANILDKSRAYAYLVAHRLKKRGAIQEVEKGKYSLEEDPFLVASWIVWPSYISGWAALSYYKLTDQVPFIIHVASTRKRKMAVISFRNASIEFIKIKPSSFFGFDRVTYHGKDIFLAEKEKAIVDALAYRKMSLQEAADMVKNNPGKINRKKLFSYAKISKGLVDKLKVQLSD